MSATGILVIQSHCSCTGKNQVSLYLPPENCASILEDHEHLFEFHADDLVQCCHQDKVNHCSSGDGLCHGCDCGCDNPEAKFFQLDHEFTEEKAGYGKVLVINDLYVIIIFNVIQETEIPPIYNQSWMKDPPPLISAYNSFIHFICNPKIPNIA